MTDPNNGAKPEAADAATDATVETAAPAVEAPLDPMVVLEAEKAELKDKLLRTLADMENLRRRTEKDLADARIYGVTRFARDMLDVADNLRRGIESVPAAEREAAEGSLKALLEGVDLTERDLLKKLETHGVKKLSPEGQKFDPNFHQAMFEVPDETKPNGTVLQVIQTGYSIGDRVLRPAMVGVSKGGPKVAPGETINRTA
ncbi:MAG: nucleotide exchange factor GrpE [Beijerinckiaceae bacterium]